MLTPYLPYPLFSGGQIRTYNLLKNLSKKHSITLFALIKNESERVYISELEKYCTKVVVFKRTEKPFALKNIFRTGFSAFPFLVIRNLVDEVKYAVEKELKNKPYDLIHAETFYMMPNIPKTKIPVLLVEQTVEYLGYMSYANSTKLWPLKPFLYMDIFKLRMWEEYFWRNCSRLVTMSQEDKKFILETAKGVQMIDVVANGVDVEFFKKTKKTLPKNPTVLFVGTFRWLPNIEAVRVLINEIWPKILQKLPKAKLLIVGNSPTDEVYRMARENPSITVTGTVKDIREAYAQAHVLLAPVFSGKGTRYKVLEAMATKTPVVGSGLAVEGIQVKPGRDVLIGNTPDELAQKTCAILTNMKLQRVLAKNGERIVFEQYNWNSISERLDAIYQEVGKMHV